MVYRSYVLLLLCLTLQIAAIFIISKVNINNLLLGSKNDRETNSRVDVSTTGHPNATEILDAYRSSLVERRQWDLRTTYKECSTVLQTPVTSLYVSETESDNCRSSRSCFDLIVSETITGLMTVGDIRYNFIIAGDGKIFEGLSWDCNVDEVTTDRKSIHVVFTGDSKVPANQINDKQYSSLKLLAEANVIAGKISPEYSVGPTCCIVSGQSTSRVGYQRLTLSQLDRFMANCNVSGQCLLQDSP